MSISECRKRSGNTQKMKKTILSTAILFLFALNANAQADRKKADKAPPLIDPITQCSLRYYYYPNIEAYFDTKKSIYYYQENGEWQTAEEIPSGYRGYSMNNKVSVYITDYDDDDVLQFQKRHKKEYPYSPNGRFMRKMTTASAD